MLFKYSGNRKSVRCSAVLLMLVIMSLLPGMACSKPGFEKATNTRIAMGTIVNITFLYEPGCDHEKIMDEAFNEITRLSALMNHYDKNSEISRLNRYGHIENADPQFVNVVNSALEFNRLTKGAFDITILPVIELFKDSFHEGKVPQEDEIKETLKIVGSDKIVVEGRNIKLKKTGMKITLDGLAKGYIVDMVSEVLLSRGIENHLINAGGDIKTSGTRQDGRPWKVAIQDPARKDNHLDVIELSNASVATSGNYENYFDAEKIFHHIANPKTGFSPVLNSSASIIAPTAMEADALATALMVMAPDYGIPFIDSLSGREVLLITRDGKLIGSSGWKSISR